VRVDRDRLSDRSVIAAGVPGAVMHWVSPVQVKDKLAETDAAPRQVDVLVRSSKDAWLDDSIEIAPDLRKYPRKGYARPTGLTAEQQGEQPLAVAITGGFPSWAAAKDKPAPGAKPDPADKKEPLLEHSPTDARVVVFGSSAFVTDELLQVADQVGSRQAAGDLQLVQNAVDWAIADTELLSIRARSSAARALTVPESERSTWEWINYAIALGALGLVVVVALVRRRSVRPIVRAEVAS